MQYLPRTQIICLTYGELVPDIISAENFRQLKVRGRLTVHGRNGLDSESLIEFGSLRRQEKEKVVEKYGDPREYIALEPIKALVETDGEARQFYAGYVLGQGQTLPLHYQLKYGRQCDWLKAIDKAMTNKKYTKEVLQISIGQLWARFSLLINTDEWHEVIDGKKVTHELPTNVRKLEAKYRVWKQKGYAGLVEAWRFGNDHRRVVTPKIENLILSLYAQPHKPYMSEVCLEYRRFMLGQRQIVDLQSGEVFDPQEFYVEAKGLAKKRGEKLMPYILAESTVDYYIKKPGNQAIVDKGRMNKLAYNTMYRPSVGRIAPFYAFSKITMDDLDIPFKTPDGDRAVKSYQIFDVASGAVVGKAFSRDKNVELIREALRDMFRLIIRNGWGTPFEIEFEKHLTSVMTGGVDQDGVVYEDVLTAGTVFPATRMCLGGNAKEKHAETFIRVKKYGQQKKRPGFQARHYARLLTNRLNAEQDKVRYQYDEIVQNELDDIEAHNNELHPKQDLYPGMTRWQVLEQNQNPILPKYQAHQIIQYIGYSTATSIRAGVARVQYGDYVLPDINLIQEQHYNGEITAYYLPDDSGQVASVYLFEDGHFLCEAKRLARFQEAIVEQTEEDIENRNKQFGQQSAFDAMVKKGRGELVPVGVVAAEPVKRTKKAVAKQIAAPVEEPTQKISARNLALRDI